MLLLCEQYVGIPNTGSWADAGDAALADGGDRARCGDFGSKAGAADDDDGMPVGEDVAVVVVSLVLVSFVAAQTIGHRV